MKFKQRKQTWEHMMLALGSSKPWVPRSLREWAVVVKSESTGFLWGSGSSKRVRAVRPGFCAQVSNDRLDIARAFLLFARPSGFEEVSITATPNGYTRCQHDHPDRVMTMRPDFIEFVMVMDKLDDEHINVIRIPTKLVIEMTRMLRHGQLSNSSRFFDKQRRRLWVQLRTKARAEKRRQLGLHNRWDLIMDLVAAMRNPTEVREVEGGLPIAGATT